MSLALSQIDYLRDGTSRPNGTTVSLGAFAPLVLLSSQEHREREA